MKFFTLFIYINFLLITLLFIKIIIKQLTNIIFVRTKITKINPKLPNDYQNSITL